METCPGAPESGCSQTQPRLYQTQSLGNHTQTHPDVTPEITALPGSIALLDMGRKADEMIGPVAEAPPDLNGGGVTALPGPVHRVQQKEKRVQIQGNSKTYKSNLA